MSGIKKKKKKSGQTSVNQKREWKLPPILAPKRIETTNHLFIIREGKNN